MGKKVFFFWAKTRFLGVKKDFFSAQKKCFFGGTTCLFGHKNVFLSKFEAKPECNEAFIGFLWRGNYFWCDILGSFAGWQMLRKGTKSWDENFKSLNLHYFVAICAVFGRSGARKVLFWVQNSVSWARSSQAPSLLRHRNLCLWGIVLPLENRSSSSSVLKFQPE